MGNCTSCVSTPLCCDRPEAELQNPDTKTALQEREFYTKRKKGMIGELAANDVLTNENRADFYAFNLDRLPL